MSSETTRNTLIGIDAGNVVFQSLCCYVLTTIYRQSRVKKTQQLYLINLAAIETFSNALLMARDVVNLKVGRLQPGKVRDVHKTFFWCMNMFYVTGVSYVYLSAMFCITGDRLCLVLFSSNYRCKMTIKRAKRLILSTWVIGIGIGIGFFMLTYFKFDYVRKEAKISKIMSVYVLSTLYAVYLVFVVVAYVSITLKYLIIERRMSLSQAAISHRPSTTQQHRPRFTLCTFLVITYVSLTLLPSLTRAGMYMAEVKVPYAITYWYLISIRISYTVDGVLYVFMQKKARELLWNNLTSWRRESRGDEYRTDNQTRRPAVVSSDTRI